MLQQKSLKYLQKKEIHLNATHQLNSLQARSWPLPSWLLNQAKTRNLKAAAQKASEDLSNAETELVCSYEIADHLIKYPNNAGEFCVTLASSPSDIAKQFIGRIS